MPTDTPSGKRSTPTPDPEKRGTPAESEPARIADAQTRAESDEPPGGATPAPAVLSHQELLRLRARLLRKYH
ncbi:hypothetical protein OG241_49145 [Streptomyces sp. NBC_01390]|uniref:hypothetical protein n=1 Tax=Streptomyces sp. NBC_01390 TaxID=2903850 RepID=UPI00324F0627